VQCKVHGEAAERGTAFRRCTRTDLEWIFTLQTQRVVAKDNTVAIKERSWQLDKSRFRPTLAGCTVTIHEHLSGDISIRYDHMWSADSTKSGSAVEKWKAKNGLHFPTATTTTTVALQTQKAGGSRRLKIKNGQITC